MKIGLNMDIVILCTMSSISTSLVSLQTYQCWYRHFVYDNVDIDNIIGFAFSTVTIDMDINIVKLCVRYCWYQNYDWSCIFNMSISMSILLFCIRYHRHRQHNWLYMYALGGRMCHRLFIICVCFNRLILTMYFS